MPACSSAVANRTLCELIKGGFIPHLEGPSTDQDRYNLLDDKLVSMHINIGIPDWLLQVRDAGDRHPDILILASAFELAYTSPERFSRRSQKSVIVSLKNAETTKKSTEQPKRLELKAFEVSDFRTYRLIEEIQLVAAAAFCAIGEHQGLTRQIGDVAFDRIDSIYSRYSISPSIITEEKKVVSLLGETDIQRELRKLLTDCAHQVRLAIR